MKVTLGSTIRISEPSEELLQYCEKELTVSNPDYAKKTRMGFWTGNMPRTLTLFAHAGEDLVLPFGCLRTILPMIEGADLRLTFKKVQNVVLGEKVHLWDYQQEALVALLLARYGILQAPAGSGKTQIGIALAQALKRKTLWLTHTKDLLTQSMTRAEQYLDRPGFGTITEGKVNIGKTMTFATIQTMAKLDLEQFKDEWDCIIVDECHRVAGTPAAVTQFSKVLNALRARHKYGLSATVHRADGMIKATYSLLGEVVYVVPKEAVEDRVMGVEIHTQMTDTAPSLQYCNTDGTINYARLIAYLCNSNLRNSQILTDLIMSAGHSNLILSDRVSHLEELYRILPSELKAKASVINGKMTSKKGKAEREQAIEDMRTGKKSYLFATYALAKEGLDIPRLDRLFLVTPQKDFAVVTQACGRIARVSPGKHDPKVYDYVDGKITLLVRMFKKRCTVYRKNGYLIF